MPELTVAEEVVLVALDGKSGSGRLRFGLDWAVAGAAILDLKLAGRVNVDDDDLITVLDPTPTGVAYLDGPLRKVARHGELTVGKLLRRTHRTALRNTVASLVRRGVLCKRRTWLLGVLPVRRYPLQEGAAKVELRERLANAVLQGTVPAERTAALIGILHSARLWRQAVPHGDRKQVKGRMGEVATGQSVSPAVRKAIVRTRLAVIGMAGAASSNG